MTRAAAFRRLLTAAATAQFAAIGSAALAQETPVEADAQAQRSITDGSFTFVDLYAGLGYSTNPFLAVGGSEDSAFGRVSANAVHNMVGERGSTTLSAFVESAYYFSDDRDAEQVFSLNASTNQQINETTGFFASAGFSRDIGGQLGNRFVVLPAVPEAPEPNLPPPVVIDDPDLFAIDQRTTRASGQLGVSVRTSERDSVTLSGGAQRTWYSGDFLDDFTGLFGTVSYNRQLSERTSAGGRLNVNRTTYDDDAGKSLIVNPELTMTTLINEVWNASFAVGVVFSKVDRDESFIVVDEDDEDWSTDISLSASFCRQGELESICASLSRNATNSAIADVAKTSSAAISWYRRLDADQTVALSAGVSRFETKDFTGEDFSTTHFNVGANYDRRISRRLFFGASVTARKLSQDGTDPDMDYGGNVYLRYRLGDLL